MLSSANEKQKVLNRKYLLNIAQTIRYLCRQGLALRGSGNDIDSNFLQLLHLRACDDVVIQRMLEQKSDKYTSPQIQNELIKILSMNILREIACSIQESRYFSIMADEVTDNSNKEQLVVCFRWVDSNFFPVEDFVGLYHVDSITADTLVKCLKDCMLRMNISLSNCRAQCYDGASNMCGVRNGVSTQIASEEPRANFVHCFGHALNLAAGDTVKQNKILKDALDTTHEISELLKFSPRREAIFQKLRNEISPNYAGFRTLCPTRWTVRASSLASVINNYSIILSVWDEALTIARDTETRARLIGVQYVMSQFEYFFGIVLGEVILKHTDNLSKTLQNPKLCSSEGLKVANLKKRTLENLRDEKNFDLFWSNILLRQQKLEVGDPVLPRKRRPPAKLSLGSATPYYPSTPKQYYRQQYYEALDLITSFITNRFDQIGMKTISALEDLLVKSARKESFETELEQVVQIYKNDINQASLTMQLQTLQTAFEGCKEKPSFSDIVA